MDLARRFPLRLCHEVAVKEGEIPENERTLLIIEAVSRQLHRIHQERALEGFWHQPKLPATSTETGH